MGNVSQSLLQAEATSFFNSSEWKAVGKPVSLEDIWAEKHPGLFDEIDGDAEVTATEFPDGSVGMRLTVHFKDGGSVELKLSSKSELEEGDMVDPNTITIQELHKAGEKPIARYDGIAK